MLKVIYNNMVIDVLQQDKYVRYLPKSQRYIMSDEQIANGILGSDNNTIYHLRGTPYNFPTEIKTVEVINIEEKEYERLTSELALQSHQTEDLRNEVQDLKKMVNEQNLLIKKLLEKLS